ncbi:rRNA maturation RNase YbeY [Mobilitalea sibirica]|uniref:Endoribonuclease YbeY n=1 Tax=Mobilitalea sibirica TaxID=1462919 RepID=A0A8J7KX78_9FIRM|nr:rRNA maturation RNase YbeY [Mobilitalea sibirica]MBH1941457.1 rRNA maturation RNase YbeY [Mobilitalea sibirica]
MTFQFNYEAIEPSEFAYEEMIRKVIEACLDYEECPYEAEVSILITDNTVIREINNEFRGIDAPTDVLSFPTIEFLKAGGFNEIDENTGNYFHPDTGELLLGDIVISMEKAIQQAKDYGHSLEREIAFLTAHSMFHLMGYDHLTEDDSSIMEMKQGQVLNQLQILR